MTRLRINDLNPFHILKGPLGKSKVPSGVLIQVSMTKKKPEVAIFNEQTRIFKSDLDKLILLADYKFCV